MKTVSVADAKNRLPELVHEVEVAPIEIRRRGRPVAVLMSKEQFDRTRARGDGVVQAAARFREAMRTVSEDWESPFEALRDRSPGRDVGIGR